MLWCHVGVCVCVCVCVCEREREREREREDILVAYDIICHTSVFFLTLGTSTSQLFNNDVQGVYQSCTRVSFGKHGLQSNIYLNFISNMEQGRMYSPAVTEFAVTRGCLALAMCI